MLEIKDSKIYLHKLNLVLMMFLVPNFQAFLFWLLPKCKVQSFCFFSNLEERFYRKFHEVPILYNIPGMPLKSVSSQRALSRQNDDVTSANIKG